MILILRFGLPTKAVGGGLEVPGRCGAGLKFLTPAVP